MSFPGQTSWANTDGIPAYASSLSATKQSLQAGWAYPDLPDINLFSWSTSKLAHQIWVPGQMLWKNPSFPGEETDPEKADWLNGGLIALSSSPVCEQPLGRRPCLYCS